MSIYKELNLPFKEQDSDDDKQLLAAEDKYVFYNGHETYYNNPEHLSACLNQAWLVQELQNNPTDYKTLPIKQKNLLQESTGLSSIQDDLSSAISLYDEKRYSQEDATIPDKELRTKLAAEIPAIENIFKDNLYPLRQLYYKYHDVLEKIVAQTKTRENFLTQTDRRLKEQFVEALRGLKDKPNENNELSENNLKQINSLLKEFAGKKNLAKRNLRLDQIEKVQQEKNAWAEVRKLAAANKLEDFLALTPDDFVDDRSKIAWRNRFLIALMALSFSGAPRSEIFDSALDALKEKIEWLKTQAQEEASKDGTLVSEKEENYDPKTGGPNDKRTLSVHPDSALTEGINQRAFFSSGIYIGEKKTLKALDIAVKNEAVTNTETYAVTIEPLGKSEIAVPAPLNVGLNPNFKMAGVKIEQYLGRLIVNLDGSLREQKQLVLPDLLIQLEHPDFTLTGAIPDELINPHYYGGEIILDALNNFYATKNLDPQYFDLMPEAQERVTKVQKLLASAQATWRRTDINNLSKADIIIDEIGHFITGPDFVYSNNSNEQSNDEAMMAKLKLKDQTVANLIRGIMDCDMGDKLGMQIYNASIIMANNNGAKISAPPLPAIATGFKNGSWELKTIGDSPRRVGYIKASSGHGVLALINYDQNSRTLTISEHDMTPTVKGISNQEEYRPNSESEAQRVHERFVEIINSFKSLPTRVESKPSERANHVKQLSNIAFETKVWLADAQLSPKDKAEYLEYAHGQVKYVKSFCDFCRHNEKSEKSDLVHRMDLLAHLHSIGVSFRADAYDIIEAEVNSELQDTQLLARTFIEHSPNYVCFSSMEQLLHNRYFWNDGLEGKKKSEQGDYFTRQRSQYFMESLELFDSYNLPEKNKLNFFLETNSYSLDKYSPKLLELIENRVYKHYESLKTSLVRSEKRPVMRFFDSYIWRNLNRHINPIYQTERLINYARELADFNSEKLPPQTPAEMAAQIMNEVGYGMKLRSFKRSLTATQPELRFVDPGADGMNDLLHDLSERFLGNTKFRTKPYKLPEEFRQLPFDKKRDVINIAIAKACQMSPVHLEEANTLLTQGKHTIYELNPPDSPRPSAQERIEDQTAPAILEILNSFNKPPDIGPIAGSANNVIANGSENNKPPAEYKPAEATAKVSRRSRMITESGEGFENRSMGPYEIESNSQKLFYNLVNFFKSNDGHEYLATLVKKLEKTYKPKYQDIKQTQEQKAESEASLDETIASNIIEEALASCLSSETLAHVNPNVKRELIEIILKQAVKVKAEIKSKPPEPIKDW